MSRIEKQMKKSIDRAVGAHKPEGKPKTLTSNPKAPKYVAPHRHCAICYTPIHKDADPPVCADEECVKKRVKHEKSRKSLNIMLYLFPGIAIMLFMIQFI